MNERFDLTGRTVIVTGGGKGIGKVYSQEFAKAGARVVAADIDGAAATVGGRSARRTRLERASVSPPTSPAKSPPKPWRRRRSIASAAIDVLINNASLMSVLARRSWLEIPVEEWDRVMAVNLRGMFLSCRAVFPAMKAKKHGKIVNISSSRVWEGNAQPPALHHLEGGRDRLHPRARARGRRVSASPSTRSPPA